MDEQLYKIMEEIKAMKINKTPDGKDDVRYLGTITVEESTPNRIYTNFKRYNFIN